MNWLGEISTVLTACVVTSLATYFITAVSSRRSLEEQLATALETHLQSAHAVDVSGLVETKLTRHVEHCNGPHRLTRIERALIFLVVKNGGNLSELGLDDPT